MKETNLKRQAEAKLHCRISSILDGSKCLPRQSRLVVVLAGQKEQETGGVTAKECEVSFGNGENVLKLWWCWTAL